MTHADKRAVELDLYRDLAVAGGLSILGLQGMYRSTGWSANDVALPPDIRELAAWLRDQAAAELTVRELDPMEAVE
jgi:hypothetical protein